MQLVLGLTIGALSLVHQGHDGRYYEEVCGHGGAYHCLAQRLLPAGFRPREDGARPAAEPAQLGQFCTGGGGPGGGSAPPAGALTPADVVAAYDIPASSHAGGAIVALVDMPDSNAYGDLNTYRKAFGIPPLPQCAGGVPDGTTPCFAAVDEAGKPTSGSQDCASADGESGLDMAMVSAACPDCSILFVQMTAAGPQGPTPQDFVTCSATAAKLGAVATSISFGGPEGQQGSDPTGYTTPGHLVLAASGDMGYLLEGESFGGGHTPSYPASSADVVSVGGTLLQKGAGGYSAVVWNDQSGATGSGCSTEFAMPASQKHFGASHFGSCAKRASVDLSAVADFTSGAQTGGIASYDSHDGWTAMVGTSAAAPLVAAILTRVGLAAQAANDVGFLYDNLAAFDDVTSGTDDRMGLCQQGDVMCTAGPGWDGPTGLGTPNAKKLQALGGANAGGQPDAGATDDAGSGGGAVADAGSEAGASPGGGDAGSGPGQGSGGSVDASAGSTGAPGTDAGGTTAPPGNSDTGNPFGAQGTSGCACSLADPSSSTDAAAIGAAGALLVLASLRVRRRR